MFSSRAALPACSSPFILCPAGPSRISIRPVVHIKLDKILRRPSNKDYAHLSKFRPPVPRRLKLKDAEGRERVLYRQANHAPSEEYRGFFSGGEAGMDGLEVEAKIGIGRVVECRRKGIATTGLVLASANVSNRPRFIILRQNGEIWTVSPADVQFLMPKSLVPSGLVERCWSPELLAFWSQGEDTLGDEQLDKDMMDARRQVVMILRKVDKETEKMKTRLLAPAASTSGLSGAEGVWEKWAGEGEARGVITAAEAAEYMLSQTGVKPNTLPAYAAHKILMDRADLFWADTADMWDSGRFMVRSRAERQRLQDVWTWVNDSGPVLRSFVTKARGVLAGGSAEWSETDVTIIRVLLQRIFETRQIQISPADSAMIMILRAIDAYPGEPMTYGLCHRLLSELGVVPRTDTLEASRCREEEVKSSVLAGVQTRDVRTSSGNRVGQQDLWTGHELDTLREDSSHTVWVIDSEDAKELDDGISFQRLPDGLWVHVHVADPTQHLPLDHPVALEASFQGSAHYFPEGNVPLFASADDALAQRLRSLSLGASEGQRTVVFSARLSEDGAVQESKVGLGWLREPRVTTYAAVDAAMGIVTPEVSRPFAPRREAATSTVAHSDDLGTLLSLGQKLLRNRTSFGGLQWEFSSGRAQPLGPTQLVRNIFHPSWTPQPFQSTELSFDYTVTHPRTDEVMTAASAVAEIMIMINSVVAQWCASRSIAIPFRGSLAPAPASIVDGPVTTVESLLAQRDSMGRIDPYVFTRSRMISPAASVGIVPVDHWLAGVQGGYTRATSPLRRFDDFLVHHQIKASLAAERALSWGKVLGGDEVTGLIKRIEPALKRAKRSQANANSAWIGAFLQTQLLAPQGVDLRALTGRVAGFPMIMGTADMQVPVHIPVLGITAPWSTSQARLARGQVDVGTEVKVRVHQAQPWTVPHVLLADG